MSGRSAAEMDDSQELPELPTKKAKLEIDGRLEKEQSNLGDDGSPVAVIVPLEHEGSYSALSTAQLDPGDQERSDADAGAAPPQACRDSLNSYAHSAADSTATSEFTQQVYQESSPAVTSYTSQVAFPPLAQSTVYSAFPQTGQTYGLPPFGSSFTTSSVYSSIPSATAATTTSTTAAHQEFSSYNSLGQSQFSQYYTLPPSYVPAGLPSSDDHGAAVGAAGYSAVKSEQAASAGLPPRDASPPESLPAGAALPTSVSLPAGARDQDEVARRNSVGKAKGKGKRSDSSPPTDSDLEVTESAVYSSSHTDEAKPTK